MKDEEITNEQMKNDKMANDKLVFQFPTSDH